MTVRPVTQFTSPAERASAQSAWRQTFADAVYGPLLPPPATTSIKTEPLATGIGGTQAVRITFTDPSAAPARLRCADTPPDAALIWPAAATTPVPVIIGLSFLGPAGVLPGNAFPIDRHAIVDVDPALGLTDGHLNDTIRGAHAARWPIETIVSEGFALMLLCYGTWAPDCPSRFAPPIPTGAISVWAAAFHRLIDAAAQFPDVLNPNKCALIGHSRLGKAALWAAATDPRPTAVIANNAGCLGPALRAVSTGEHPRDLAARYPHWVGPDFSPDLSAVDQHQLIACIAPRTVIIGTADDDAWADPAAEYAGLRAAAPAWPNHSHLPATVPKGGPKQIFGAPPLIATRRPGPHALTQDDWALYLPALKAALSDEK